MFLSLPAALFRGGTSKGLFFVRDDLAQLGVPLDVALTSVMGGADPRQIDGIGGGSTTTSKVAIVSRSAENDIDVDYLFAQVDPQTGTVDWTPTCGNVLTGVGPFAIERGLVPTAGDTTQVRVRLVNTGAKVVLDVCTRDGRVQYSGGHRIAGVAAAAAPVRMTFTDFVGGTSGSLFPTGNRADVVGGIAVSCVDAGVCAMLVRADDLGVVGDESPAEINANRILLQHVESMRRAAGELMGMGDVAGRVVPKVMIVSNSPRADIRSRYLVPTSCHPAHTVSGAINLVTALSSPGTVAHSLAPGRGMKSTLAVEHPAGIIDLDVVMRDETPVGVALTRTARKIFEGSVFCEIDDQARRGRNKLAA
ncbi:protein of unknown function DUF453 [Segniliparus rotundus DSM 44985]|uniref:PrpF protein n=2 Tax=Segniliparus rotundus TaxID=286802 RepID=D6ZBE3_SEGRD|nr:protein of unknown function DUF453 [Segniliparus rotundus DSM 44985]